MYSSSTWARCSQTLWDAACWDFLFLRGILKILRGVFGCICPSLATALIFNFSIRNLECHVTSPPKILLQNYDLWAMLPSKSSKYFWNRAKMRSQRRHLVYPSGTIYIKAAFIGYYFYPRWSIENCHFNFNTFLMIILQYY